MIIVTTDFSLPRPALSETAKHSIVRSNQELVDLQIHQLERQLDDLNIQLAEVMTQQQTVKEGIKRTEEGAAEGGESAHVLQTQLGTLNLKAENLLKKIAQVGSEISKKKK